MEKFFNFLLDLIKIIKPEHRKWVVKVFILAGISMLTYKVWQPYLDLVTGIKPSITIDVTAWVLIIIGISLFLLNRYDERHARQQELRPLLVHSVERREAQVQSDILFNDIILIIENQGNLTAANHVPSLVIKEQDKTIFDNSKKLAEVGLVGEIPADGKVEFSLCELLNHPISALCNHIALMGFLPVVVSRDFKVTAYSTYTGPGETQQYNTPKFEFDFRWFREDGTVKVSVSGASRTRRLVKKAEYVSPSSEQGKT